jgi:hypothetical protein
MITIRVTTDKQTGKRVIVRYNQTKVQRLSERYAAERKRT